MNKKKRRIARLLLFVTVFNLFAWAPTDAAESRAASSVPGIDAKVTRENVLALLDKYDEDGAYILRTTSDEYKKQKVTGYTDFLRWWFGEGRIIDSLDVAVHEETHGYLEVTGYNDEDGWKDAHFIGNKQTVYVNRTDVFRSKKMANSIPENLRTSRYDHYIANVDNDKYLDSDVGGAYGLLNEFAAYRAGMNTSMSLSPYLEAEHADLKAWCAYDNGGWNGHQAYAEFKYYILHYLYYAKEHYPSIYKGIMNNSDFCKAYWKIESRYADLVNTYLENCKKMPTVLEQEGYIVEIDGNEVIASGIENGEGDDVDFMCLLTEPEDSEYSALMNELSKTRYQSIHDQLVKNGKAAAPIKLAKQTVKTLKTVKGRKLTVGWKKATKASGYQIQYSTDKNFKKGVKTKTVASKTTTSKTLTKLTKGKRYYVRVRSYRNTKVNGKSTKIYGAWSSAKRSGKIKK